MFQLDYKSGVPICDQIVNAFIRMKALKILDGGQQLPSVRSLAIDLSVNPNTIQKAYSQLESMGIIYSVKGKGSFMSEDASADLVVIKTAKANFAAAVSKAREMGLTKSDVIEILDEEYKERGL